MLRRMAILAMVSFISLAAPRASEADLVEFIWGMSGPQMLGVGAGCRYDFKIQRQECTLGAPPADPKDATTEKGRHGPFLSIGGAYFVSTDKDSSTQEYSWLDAQMLAFEPGLSFRSDRGAGDADLKVYHGAGISYDFLFGRHFEAFDKFGIKITPVEVDYKRVAVGFNLRFYPHGFSDDEFGFGERAHYDRPSEWTWGGSFSYVFKRHR